MSFKKNKSVGWESTYYDNFREDLTRWNDSDRSLGEEIIKKCEAIEKKPFKGDTKPGGPIAGCRAVYLRDQKYAIIYEIIPDPYHPSNTELIEELRFYGVLKHDNQSRGRTGTENPPVTMIQYEIEIPAEEAGRIHSAFRSTDGIYVYDGEIEWEDPTVICGEYERKHEDQFQSLASEGEIVKTERRSPEDFLVDP